MESEGERQVLRGRSRGAVKQSSQLCGREWGGEGRGYVTPLERRKSKVISLETKKDGESKLLLTSGAN